MIVWILDVPTTTFLFCAITVDRLDGMVALEVQDGPVVQLVKFIRVYWLLLLPAALLGRFLYYRYASPLRQYPGPLLASGSRAWKVWSTYNGKTETDHIELHERYGMLLREVHQDTPLIASR